MKPLITLLLLAILSSNAYSQGFSAGLSTGLGATADITQPKLGTMTKSWDKELFLRYETKGRIALETGVNNYSYTYDPTDFYTIGFCATGDGVTNILSTSTNYKFYDVSLGVQLDVTCKKIKAACPALSNMKSYIGLSLGNSFVKTSTVQAREQITTGEVKKQTINSSYYHNPFLGLKHIVIYSFSRLYLISIASYEYHGYQLFNKMPNSSFSVRAGIGYKF